MDQTEQEKSIQELREKFPEEQRNALMDDFLDGIFLTEEDKKLVKKLKKLGCREEKECEIDTETTNSKNRRFSIF